MRDLIEQLDSYQGYLDDRYPAVTASEVLDGRFVELKPLIVSRQRSWTPVVTFAAAFVAVVVVGIGVYLLGSPDAVVTDTTLEVATTEVRRPVVPVSTEDLATWEWNQVAAGASWADSVLDLAGFDDGSFVALVDAEQTVYWSPDGVEWIGADPNRIVTPNRQRTVPIRLEQEVITTVGNQAVILGEPDAGQLGLWIGVPAIGEWDFLPLNTDGISGSVRALAIASNDTEALVVGIEWIDATLQDEDLDVPDHLPFIVQYLTWTIDLDAGSVERNTLSVRASGFTNSVEATVDWYAGSWYVALVGDTWIGGEDGWISDEPVLTSPDGRTWTATGYPVVDADGSKSGGLVSLTAGESSIIIVACNFGGDTFNVSTDGAAWKPSSMDYGGHRSVYADALGFVVVSDAVVHSPDGQTWTPIPNSQLGPSLGTSGGVLGDLTNLAASNTAILLSSDVEPGLWLYTKP